MARTRYLKHAFFRNEQLADLEPLTRLLFAGLWLLADREGRLEDRPRRIRADLFPYDPDLETDPMLSALAVAGFILRYEVEGERFIEILNFGKHQHPHYNEPASELPPAPGRENKRPRLLAKRAKAGNGEDPQVPEKPDTSGKLRTLSQGLVTMSGAVRLYNFNSNSNSNAPEIERQKTSLSLSRGPSEKRERERVSQSQFSLKECREYAESLPQITTPGGFAKSIWRSGEEDEQIAVWKGDGGGKETEDERRNRLRRLRQNQRDH